MSIVFAGVSRLKGELKFRTATDDKRFLQLTKLGDTDVEFTSVNAQTKQEAAEQLLARNFANGRVEIEALLNEVTLRTKPKREVKVTVPTRFAQEMQGAKVKVEPVQKRVRKADKMFGAGPTLSVEEANARVAATVKEITPERALELLVRAMPKKRRSRKVQEAV
jgi:hypothetical protein